MQKQTVMSLDAIRDALGNLPSMTPVMMATGVHLNQLYRIANGKANSVNYTTLVKLDKYLSGLNKA